MMCAFPVKRNFILVGAPDDRGVANVDGRVGAKEGPCAIRRALSETNSSSFLDDGDLPIKKTQEETCQLLREKIQTLHQQKYFPILIGGGHDLSFGSLSGFLDIYPDGGVVNIDPHLDARPILELGKISSGSAYRLLLEKKRMKGNQLMEFGFQMDCNQPSNFDFLKNSGAQLIPWPASGFSEEWAKKMIRPFIQSLPAFAVSFDLDSIRSDFAPGVSAPAKIGYTSDEALKLVRTLKQFSNLKQFEIMEMNPKFDPDRRTAKLAAELIRELLAH